MSTPLQRLKAIVDNIKVSKVQCKVSSREGSCIVLTPYKTSTFEVLPSDDKLQAAIKPWLREHWDADTLTYKPDYSVQDLFSVIKERIFHHYSMVSSRCAATKRKTEQFIDSILLEQTAHAGFLMGLFIQIMDSSFDKKPLSDKQAVFESIESMRRANAKLQHRK